MFRCQGATAANSGRAAKWYAGYGAVPLKDRRRTRRQFAHVATGY